MLHFQYDNKMKNNRARIHYWWSANQILKFLVLRKAHCQISSPETYNIKTRDKLSAQTGLSNWTMKCQETYNNKTCDPWAIPGFADVTLSFTESAKPGITKLVCIWLASSHSELDYVCKTKFIFHTKCTLSSKTWFNGAKPDFAIKPGLAIAKPCIALLNYVFLCKTRFCCWKGKFLKHWFEKPGISIEKPGFAEKKLVLPLTFQVLQPSFSRYTWFISRNHRFYSKTKYNRGKLGFAEKNLILLLKNMALLRKTWFIRAKPGLSNRKTKFF